MTNRRFHRWLSVVGIVFFVLVSTTGVWLQLEQSFGTKEAEHEALAAMISPDSLSAPLPLSVAALDRARATIFQRYGNRPVVEVDWMIKAPVPAFIFHLDGATPLKVTVNISTSNILTAEPDGEDWLLRLHTGEIFGDGGKFLGLGWGLGLIGMIVSGSTIYWQILRARDGRPAAKAQSWRRWFW